MRSLRRTGPSKTLSYADDFPDPTSKSDPDTSKFYLIHTHAVALTRGELAWPEPLSVPIPIPGYDIAGTIVCAPTVPASKRGSEQTIPPFKPGDAVYALTSFSRQGNAREVSIALEDEIALKPKNLGWEEAASVPLSALTAYQALFVHAGLKPPTVEAERTARENEGKNIGKRVLVTAAAGGVGVWAVQLAHAAGARVVGTCGTSNVDFVKSLGADEVIDYSGTNLLDWVNEVRENRAFDIVLDCVGGQALEDAWKTAKPGGRVISVAEPPDTKKPKEGVQEGVESRWFIVEPNGSQLEEITKFIEGGKGKGVVDSVYDLQDWEKAFERLESGHAKGKVVLKVR